MTASACPGVDELSRFRRGRLSEDRALQVEQHLAGCSACLGRIPPLDASDPLVQAMRAQKGKPRLSNPMMESLRQELRSRPLDRRALPQTGPTLEEDKPSLDETIAAGQPKMSREEYPFLSAPRSPDELGWLGTFRVLKVLGQGGMGMVLQAEDTRLQRMVALKVMKPSVAIEPKARQRFLREARATAKLEHDHIIAIHQIDEIGDTVFLAMPLLHGETLDDRLRRESILPVREVLRIGRETAEALAAAHERELIHRDIKPANLWLEAPSGRVKVLDFGLASMPCSEGEKTLPGTILGTPGYMAPEQTESEADQRSDLFSLGVVLYRMATGRMPFKGDSPLKKIRSVLIDDPEPPEKANPSLPAPLCHLITRLLSRNPADRPAKAIAVARVLQTIEAQLSGAITVPVAKIVPAAAPRPGATPPVALPGQPSPDVKRTGLGRRAWIGIGGGVAALALLITVLILSLGGSSGDSDDDLAGNGQKKQDAGVRNVQPAQRIDPSKIRPVIVEVDASFPENWVTSPTALAVPNVDSWCILYYDDPSKYYPVKFEFTHDERLLIQYHPHGYWTEFNPQTSLLGHAPFQNQFSALTGNGRAAARVTGAGVQLWEEGATKGWITLNAPGNYHHPVYSPGGKLIAIGSSNQPHGFYGLRVYDAEKGNQLGQFSPPHWFHSATLAWSPDAQSLALFSSNELVILRHPWDKPHQTVARPTQGTALAWSPDGKYLATREADRKIRILDVASGKAVAEIAEPLSSIAPAWSPDGRELAFGTSDREVVVWNVQDNKITYRFSGHKRGLTAVAFLGDGRTLISGSGGTVRFWDLKTNSFRGTLLFDGTHSLALSPEGYYRCSPGGERTFRFRVKFASGRNQDYSLAEFQTEFQWKNQPDRVKLTNLGEK
jgi:hypothetical protein